MKIIIASTSFHLINALILKHQLNEEFFLIYIGKENEVFNKVKTYFVDSLILIEDKNNKYNLRIQNAKKLLELVKNIKPSEIIIGNDRKIENSILIANYKVNYSYLDDGLHSYILENQHMFKYTIFEKKLKEFLYKNRLVLPKYIGSSEYIKKAYVYKPEFVHKYLKEKVLIKLTPDTHFLRAIFKENIPEIKKLILFPHPKFIDDKKIECIKKYIDENTFIKLHPRDNKTKLNAKKIDLIAEVLFLNLKEVQILGFNTTALLTAKWLNSNLDVKMIKFDKNLSEIEKFMIKNGIKEINC
ncbi:hypothetical protein FE773_01470 [Caminibacter mediatlanticus TB-2]|uniref:UDP-N-acetylglucosamine 2-epimerase domain-containing protein n=1 Tax=Caminibacter mediatlanticus TB-2 TaxID=391592 RepID=A0ABX5V6J6_9BACT|nr:hypothetical protein [Caminibacter mediatlanticus]QCT93895.1 hypothetical protein FE773_01470 [Caminibacter mediatlanticus TB-2]